MPKNISWRKLVQKFRRLEFDGPYSGGRHLFMVKGGLKVRIPNPRLQKLLKKIRREARQRKKHAKPLSYKEAIEHLDGL